MTKKQQVKIDGRDLILTNAEKVLLIRYPVKKDARSTSDRPTKYGYQMSFLSLVQNKGSIEDDRILSQTLQSRKSRGEA
jgi:hypothetical protein